MIIKVGVNLQSNTSNSTGLHEHVDVYSSCNSHVPHAHCIDVVKHDWYAKHCFHLAATHTYSILYCTIKRDSIIVCSVKG